MNQSNGQTKKNKIETVAIIPVRGNSKRIPGKNLRVFAGKVLFCWTIDAAMQSPEIDFVILTTESQEIAAAAKRYVGDTYPEDYMRFNVYMRPPELSQDHVQTDEVLLFTLRQMEYQGLAPNIVVTLLATSPLRTAGDIFGAFQQFRSALNYRTLVSGQWAEKGFYWHWTGWPDTYRPIEDHPEFRPGTQWLTKKDRLFKEDGAIYINYASDITTYKTKMVPLFTVYETGISVDIDTEEDWKNAEKLVTNRQPAE